MRMHLVEKDPKNKTYKNTVPLDKKQFRELVYEEAKKVLDDTGWFDRVFNWRIHKRCLAENLSYGLDGALFSWFQKNKNKKK